MIADGQVLRRPDGSINIEFYRDIGLAERRDVLRAFARGIACLPSKILRLTQRRCDGHHIVAGTSRLSGLAPDPA